MLEKYIFIKENCPRGNAPLNLNSRYITKTIIIFIFFIAWASVDLIGERCIGKRN